MAAMADPCRHEISNKCKLYLVYYGSWDMGNNEMNNKNKSILYGNLENNKGIWSRYFY
jgi:hypothetical protein